MTKLTTWQATIQDYDTGAAIVSPVITIRLGGPAGALADLFDLTGAPLGVNPVTGGLDGFVQVQMRPGRYWVQAADGGTFSNAWYIDVMPEEGLSWATRAEFVADVAAGMDLPDGTVVSVGVSRYAYKAGDTTTSDIPGWRLIGVDGIASLEYESKSLNVIAHRGFRNVNIQNTLMAYSEADKYTKHWEADVSWSADGTAYLFHDQTVDALTDGTGTFTTLSDATIDGLSFDGLSGSDLSDLVRIPKFEDFLKLASSRGSFIWPEIKAVSDSGQVNGTAQLVIDYNMQSRCVLQSFSISDVISVLDYSDDISCGYLVGSSTLSEMQSYVDSISEYPGRAFLLPSSGSVLANPSIVEYSLARGVGIGVYTVNDQSDADALTQIGVYNIITDIPLNRA